MPPGNVPPTAVIGNAQITGLTVGISGASSSDPDGTITGYAWNFGDNATGTAPTPSHTYASAGTYTITLTVTDNDGATNTATRQVIVTTPPVGSLLAQDSFGRTTSNGWGAADSGGNWTVSGSPNRYSVADGTGKQALTVVGTTTDSVLASVASVSTDLRVSVSWNRSAAAGALYTSLIPRRVSSTNDYRCKVVVTANDSMRLDLTRRVNGVETTMSTTRVSGITHVPTESYEVACRAIPNGGGTQVTGKLWRTGTTEPSTWQTTATDITPALQAAGGIGVSTYLSSSATNGVTLHVGNLTATDPAPPGNVPPTAVIGNPQIDNLTVSLNGASSNDPDGTITGHSWNFGDNTTGTGPTPSHTYTTAGDYTITLTVTDNNGATGTSTKQVTVTAPPPAGGPLALDSFGRTTNNGWGTADPGGNWSVSGAANRFSVSGDTGKQALSLVGTTADSALTSVSSLSTELRASLSWSRTAASGPLYASVIPRRPTGTNDYRCKAVVTSGGLMRLDLVRRVNGIETTLGTAAISGITQMPNQSYDVACRAVPSGGGSQISGKLWRTGTAEPSGWQVIAMDSTPALQAPGGVGLSSYLSSSSTQGVTLSVGNFIATDPVP